MAKSKLTPQTPGEPLPEETTPAPEAAAEQTPDQPTTTETAPAADAAPDAAADVADVVTPAKPLGELPDQSEIDPASITRPVLSKQGWVVPKG